MIASIIPRDAQHFAFRAMLSGMVCDESGENDGVLHLTYQDPEKVLRLIKECGGELLCVEDEIGLTKTEMFTK
jgi:hypothetical protein